VQHTVELGGFIMNNKFTLKSKVGIFAFCIGAMANNMTMALVAYIMASYSNVSASIVQNILVTPSLVATVYAFFVGQLNTKFSTKKLLLFGQICLLAMGMIFMFLGGKISIWGLVIAAGLVGIGQGSNNTILGSMLADMISDEKERGSFLGICMAVMNVGGVFFSIVGGKIADISGSWQTAYGLYFIVLAAIVLEVLCLPEGSVAKADASAGAAKENTSLPAKVWVISIHYFFFFLALYVYGSNISQYIVTYYQLGGAAEAGIATSVVTIGGIVAGAAFGIYSQWFKKWTVPITMGMAALGLFLCLALHTTIWGAYIGGALCGFSMSAAGPYIIMELGRIAPGPMYSKAMSIYSGFMNAGMCVAIYVINIITGLICGDSSDIHTKFVVGCVLALITAVTAIPIYVNRSKAN
jgi:MFS family permease